MSLSDDLPDLQNTDARINGKLCVGSKLQAVQLQQERTSDRVSDALQILYGPGYVPAMTGAGDSTTTHLWLKSVLPKCCKP